MSWLRKFAILAAAILVIGGLLLCGPAHQALHAHHGLDLGALEDSDHEPTCDVCYVSSVESPEAIHVIGPLLDTVQLFEPQRAAVPHAQRPVLHSPRGPPARF